MEYYLLIDGYTDEPAGLGVPPYLDVYPRYIAGAIWSLRKSASILYFTVDQVRRNLESFLELSKRAKLVIFIAGILVPGKYLGGEPITPQELRLWSRLIDKPIKILGGPVAKFGIGTEGGKVASLPEDIKNSFDIVVKGDVEEVVYELIRNKFSLEKTSPYLLRKDYSMVKKFAVKGAKIVIQHPNYSRNLIVELETYRGCPRYIRGGCSFCLEPLYGKVIFRPIKDILEEVRALYAYGVFNFRLGRQADIFSYLAKDTGKEEYPRPNVNGVKSLFVGIRRAAPGLKVLHIDNVNPGTIIHYPKESRDIIKVIIKNHTPGDVAALGIESADPRVIRLNNLKTTLEESIEVIRILNELGLKRGYNGMPELLPGINFVFGLIGETKKTFELDYLFLKRIRDHGLLVRRINIRQVLIIPGTRMWTFGIRNIRRHKKYFKSFKERVRKEFDNYFLKKIVPRGTILREVFTEKYIGKYTLGRQIGSYPLLIYIPQQVDLFKFINIMVIDHGYRSVTGIPYPCTTINRRIISKYPFLKEIPLSKEIKYHF